MFTLSSIISLIPLSAAAKEPHLAEVGQSLSGQLEVNECLPCLQLRLLGEDKVCLLSTRACRGGVQQ